MSSVIHYCDPTVYSDHTRGPGYVIVGHVDSPNHAEAHGGHVGDGETVVWVPADIIDELVQQRVAELEARLGELIDSRETFAKESHRRLLRIEELEAANAQYRTLIDAIPFFRDDDYQDELAAAAEAALADPKETTL